MGRRNSSNPSVKTSPNDPAPGLGAIGESPPSTGRGGLPTDASTTKIPMIPRLRGLTTQAENINATNANNAVNNAGGAVMAWAPHPDPPQTLVGEFNMELLRRNKFCQGIKRGNRYIRGGEAGENARGKAVELLAEAVGRMWRWRVWETWWVDEIMDEWLEKRDRLEVQLRGKYGEEVVNAITGLVDKFIGYNEQFLNYWREVGNEVRKLIDDLMSGKAEVIISESGRGISVHGEHITLNAHWANNDGITVKLVLKGLGGVTIEVPNVFVKTMSKEEYAKFVNEALIALRGGFAKSDEAVDRGRPVMGTAQVWQTIIWPLLYPGEVYMSINSVDVNKEDVTIAWHLRANNHRSLKGAIFSGAEKLNDNAIFAFVFAAVLGDGFVDIERTTGSGAMIRISMSADKFETWKPLLSKLWDLGFRWGKSHLKGDVIDLRFFSSNAISLARVMISVLPPILKDVLDVLNIEKWLNLRRIAEMEVKWRRGEMQIDIAGVKFTVIVNKGAVELVHSAKDDSEVSGIINVLKARYGDEFAVRINRGGKYRNVVIPMYIFERYNDIKEKVIQVLCRKLEKTKDERKRQVIIKHLRRLAPTKGAAAGLKPREPSSP